MLSFQSRAKPKNSQDFSKSKPNLIPRLTTTIKKADQNTHKITSPGKTRASTTIIPDAVNLAFEEPLRRLSKGTESLYKLSVSQRFEKPIINQGKPWTILEHKREEEEEIAPSTPIVTRTLDRYTFYQNGFSLFGSFQDSSKDLNDTKGSVVEDSMEKKNMTWSSGYYHPKPSRNEPKEGARRESGTSKSNSIMKKISQIAIPQGNTATKKKTKALNEAKSERNGKPKMVESMWLSAHFADKSDQVEFSNSAVFISPKPQQPNPKIFRKSASLRQKTEEDSPSSMSKEGYRSSKNPLIEPESDDYGKFNKLFRDVENRSSKKLDPERYQKIVNRTDSSSNLGLMSPKKVYAKQSSFTSGERTATKYFFGNKRPSEVFNKKNTSKDFGTRIATKHTSFAYEAKKPKEYYLGN